MKFDICSPEGAFIIIHCECVAIEDRLTLNCYLSKLFKRKGARVGSAKSWIVDGSENGFSLPEAMKEATEEAKKIAGEVYGENLPYIIKNLTSGHLSC